VFGKASPCENPALVWLNDQNDFREQFRKAHPPKMPAVAAATAEGAIDPDGQAPTPGPEQEGEQ